jgi:hypothetical protein
MGLLNAVIPYCELSICFAENYFIIFGGIEGWGLLVGIGIVGI